jgi:DNA polymerase
MLAEMGVRLFEPSSGAAGAEPDEAAVAVEAVVDDATTERPAEPALASSAPSIARRGAEAPVDVAPAEPPSPRAAEPPPMPAGSPRSATIATLDWQPLRDMVAGCTACALCESRRNTVFGVGNTRAHWMIVGEAPGEQEDRQGEPFVGPAGQLLDSMLRALGLTRDEAPPERQVFIVNTLKCRPPRNRNPDPAEMAKCEPFLQRQIALVQPRVILAMGRFAVQALLRTTDPVGRLRGRVHRYEGVPLVVTYHPAYLLRQPADKARSWDDLCLAAEVLEGVKT